MSSNTEQRLCDERMRTLDRLDGRVQAERRPSDPGPPQRGRADAARGSCRRIATGDGRGRGFNRHGCEIIEALAADPLVSHMLIIHDLHPHDTETRIRGALRRAKPYLESHGGNVELVEVTPGGVVHLRMEGSCHGCPSSRVTLQSLIEQEIFAVAPDVTGIVVDGLTEEAPAPAAAGFVPIQGLRIHGSQIRAAVS